MASPAEVVLSCLIDLGLVVQEGVPNRVLPYQQVPGDGSTIGYVSSMPDDSDQAVCVKDMVGRVFQRPQRGKQALHPGVKVEVRSLDFTGYDLANAIAVGLDSIVRKTTNINGVTYFIQSVYRTTPVVPMGEEKDRKRQLWFINARVAFQDQQPSLG